MEFLSEHKNPLTQSRINHGPQKFQTSKLQIRTCFRCMFDTMTEQDMIRGHRKKSVMLTDSELLEVRARQRTFEGAYWRTSIMAVSTGLLILKVFTKDFYKIGITFFVFGLVMLGIAVMRRRKAGDVFDLSIPFQTSGNWVLLTTAVTMATYIILLILLLKL
ncbi:unnamed protein product [Umbelopsis vinacea]